MADTSVEGFRKRFDEAERQQKRWASTWRQNNLTYRGKNRPAATGNDVKRGRDTALYIPYVEQQIDTIKCRLVEPNPSFRYHPTEPTDEDVVEKISVLRRYHRNRDEYVRKQEDWVHDALICQLAVGKVTWIRREVTRKRKRKLNALQKMMRLSPLYDEQVLEMDQPTVTVVDPYDFFPDPSAADDKTWRYVFHRVWLTKEDLIKRRDAGIYQNVDELLKGDKHQNAGWDAGIGSEGAEESRKDRYEVIEEWTCEGIKVWGNRRISLRDEPNDFGFIPFAATCTQPVRGSLVGRSEVEQISGLQDFMWTIDNLRIEGAKRAINPPMKYRRTMKGGKDFKVIPGGRIGLDRMDDVEVLIQNPGQTFGVEEGQILLGQMQNMTGASSYLSGADSALAGTSQSTATGISLIQTEANRQMAAKMLNLQLFHARIEKMSLRLEQMYLSKSQFVRITGSDGDQWLEIEQADIQGDFDIEPEWESLEMNRERERTSNIELINTLLPLDGIKFADGTTPNLKPAIVGLVRSYDRDPNPFFSTVEARVQQEVAEQQMMQAAMPPEQQDGPPSPQQKMFESINFKDIPADAQAAMLEVAGLPSQGVRAQDELETAQQMADLAKTQAAIGQTAHSMQMAERKPASGSNS